MRGYDQGFLPIAAVHGHLRPVVDRIREQCRTADAEVLPPLLRPLLVTVRRHSRGWAFKKFDAASVLGRPGIEVEHEHRAGLPVSLEEHAHAITEQNKALAGLRQEQRKHEKALEEARSEQAKARGNVMQKEKRIKKAEKALETKVRGTVYEGRYPC